MVRAAKPCALLCLSPLGSCTWENGVCRCVIPKPRRGSVARVESGASAQYPLLEPQTCHPAARARALCVQPASTPCTWAREGVRASPVPTAAAQPESRLLAMKQSRKPPQWFENALLCNLLCTLTLFCVNTTNRCLPETLLVGGACCSTQTLLNKNFKAAGL